MATIMRVGGGAGKAESKNPAVSTLAEEKILLITENGIPTEYYIAKHGYEPELNGANRTLLVRKDIHSNRAWDAGNVSAYADSDADIWLNGEFYNCLSANVRDLLSATAFQYTVGNGDKTVTTLERAVFLLSATELGYTHTSINIEGSLLPTASILKIAQLNGTNSGWWTRSPATNVANYAHYSTNTGVTSAAYVNSSAFGIRPVFTIPSAAKVVGPDNYGRYSLEAETASEVYGIARDITSSSPEWVRTDGAMTFTAKASIGTVAGSSDFDNIYPWSEMQRVTLDSGDVMVRIPKFYYGRYRNGNIERIQISGRADVGLTLHPAFNHAGVERDCIYVGAYKTSSNNKSVSGASPQVSQTRATFRSNAKAKGSGWSLIDISTLSAIQMLYLVEFANNNSQAMVGRGYVDGNTAALVTGTADTVPNLTGRPTGTDGKTDVVYRGMEGLWGNIFEFVDGINAHGNAHYYTCNDPSKYVDDGDTSTYAYSEFAFPKGGNGGYITTMGLDTTNPHLILPSAASGGSETTYFCDGIWSTATTTGWFVCLSGSVWNVGSPGGLFISHFSVSSSTANTSIGSRLIYIPQ